MLSKLSFISVSFLCKMKKLTNYMMEKKVYMKQLFLLGIEYILPSIFRYNTVLSSIPSYFENTETPIVCQKYNKPIRNTKLHFNKISF